MKLRFKIYFALIILIGCSIGCVQEMQAKVTLSKKSLTLFEDSVKSLSVSTSKKVKWSSANRSIASVSSKGKVYAKEEGSTTIIATVGRKKYSCKVTVKARTMTVSKEKYSITKKSTVPVYYTEEGKLFYSIEDTDVVSCSWGSWKAQSLPLIITPISNGTTKITITNSKNKETVVIQVKVTNQENGISRFTKMDLNVIAPDTGDNHYIEVTYYNGGMRDLFIPDYVKIGENLLRSSAPEFVEGVYKVASKQQVTIKYYIDPVQISSAIFLEKTAKASAEVQYNKKNYILQN